MKIRYVNLQKVTAIQKAAQSALLIGPHPKDIRAYMIPIYWDYYKHTKRTQFLALALEHIAAYIKSNFDFSAMLPLFSEITTSAGYASFDDFLSCIHRFHGK